MNLSTISLHGWEICSRYSRNSSSETLGSSNILSYFCFTKQSEALYSLLRIKENIKHETCSRSHQKFVSSLCFGHTVSLFCSLLCYKKNQKQISAQSSHTWEHYRVCIWFFLFSHPPRPEIYINISMYTFLPFAWSLSHYIIYTEKTGGGS